MFKILQRFISPPKAEPVKAKSLATNPREELALSLVRGKLSEKARERYMKVLAEFPQSLLHQFRRDGITFTTFEAFAVNTRYDPAEVGGGYVPDKKRVIIPERHLFGEKTKRFLAHEMGHAIDHSLQMRNEPRDRFQQSGGGYGDMHSSHDGRMKELFRQFSARQLASKGAASRSYPGAVFEVRVEEKGGSVTVEQEQTKHEAGSLFAKRDGGWGLGWASRKTYVFNGHKVKYSEKGAKQTVSLDSRLPDLSWLPSPEAGQYLQQSGQPAELFADGVGAYLGGENYRASLKSESSDLFSHVESEIERYL